MTFGITPQGFTLKRLADIRDSLHQRAISAFGDRVQLHAHSVLGRLIDVFAAEQAETWEAIAASYAAFDPNTATGAALDVVGALNQLPRQPAQYSTGEVRFEGQPGVTIPRRTQIEQVVSGDIWITTEELTLDSQGGGSVPVRSLQRGPYTAPGDPDPSVATLRELATPISGVDRVWNPGDALIGRHVETDEAYRARIAQDRNIGGTRLASAIEAHLRALEGVFDARLVLNTTDQTDSAGRPMRTFEAVVEGGDPEDIARTLWEHKPNVIVPRHSQDAIDSGAAVTVEIEDAAGMAQEVRFSRPIDAQIEMWIITAPVIDLGTDEIPFKDDLVAAFQRRQGLGESVKHYAYVCEVSALLRQYGYDFDELTLWLARLGDSLHPFNVGVNGIEIARLETANIEVNP